MVGKRKLSASEVASLVKGLGAAEGSASDAGDLAGRVKPWRLGESEPVTAQDFHALRMINERFCRIARRVFLPLLRLQPRLSAFPPEIRSFDEYRDTLENFVSLTTSRINELRGNQMIVMTPAFVSVLTDSYFGGALRRSGSRRAEFTATEQRVIEIVTDGLNTALEAAWRDLTGLTFATVSREENLQFATFVDGKDPVVVCSFMVQLPGVEPEMVDILYPLQTLRPLAGQLRSRMQSEVVDDDAGWRQRLRHAILSVPLGVNVQLCAPVIDLRRLMRLQPGALLPASIPDRVSLRLGGQSLTEAELGEVSGRLALRITRAIGAPVPEEPR